MPSIPVRYPNGVTTDIPKSPMRSFPAVPAANQFVFAVSDFVPYQAGQWTVTQTNGTAATYAWPAAVLKQSTTGGTSADAIYNAMVAQAFQFKQGSRMWHEDVIAISSASATDINFFSGFSDNVNPNSATNAVYFKKPSGGTAIHLVVIKGGTTTTFQNVADIAKPSGLYGDANSSVGTITANATGTTLTALTIGAAGAGYNEDPLVIVTGTAGSGAQARVELGSGSLYNTVVTAAGSGYTAGTFAVEVDHFIKLQIMYDGRGNLYVGVNDNVVMLLGDDGTAAATAGSTYAVNSVGSSFYAATNLTAGVMTNQPAPNDAINMLPLVPMYVAVGFLGTTANARNVYHHGVRFGGEY